ncbi:MAG TPA: hypothetical protein VFK42_19910 [Acidimicrobiales bacterium]|nr:hypothetical protein [Acidimicrobiales bacterium]
MADRYVVLGLAPARSRWFGEVAQWSHGAALPIEFVKCVSPTELTARLASGRTFSAVLVDAGQPGLDRDLVDGARAAGAAVIVVADDRTNAMARDWTALGASTVLPATLSRDELLEALATNSQPIRRGETLPRDADVDADGAAHWRGRMVAVVGPGGTGTSTAAIALAQGLGGDVDNGGLVVLADLQLHAEQAMLHDARDVVPGVQELVDAHRSGHPTLDEVRALTYRVDQRRYHLLLGLRRARFWSTLRPRAVEAALTSLARAFSVVVCDVGADVEGEDDGGSADVEERNVLARTALGRADVVIAVGSPTMKGAHSLGRVIDDVVAFGVAPARIAPVFNRAPRAPRHRAQLTSAIADLAGPAASGDLPSPVFLPERRVDDALRDGVRLPGAIADPLVAVYRAVLARTVDTAPAAARHDDDLLPRRVRPGELGAWAPS